jgi:serine/threonine-protein kinase
MRAVAHVSSPRSPENGPEPTRLAHFRIVKRIGAGGMGIVYRATDDRLQRSVALKVLPIGLQSDPERQRRLLREARSAAAITHPNIATVYEIGEAEGRIFIAMELVEGTTLRSRIARGALSLAEAMPIALQLLDALAHAHDKGIIHCDLKPENIMIDAKGHVKVLDFGLAKVVHPQGGGDVTPSELAVAETTLRSQEKDRVVGTPGYMAPEQLNGTEVDARADIFAFGVTLFEMLAGVRPFAGATAFAVLCAVDRDPPTPLHKYNSRLPLNVVKVVERCLAKAPAHRFASATDVLGALGASDGRAPHLSAALGSPRGRWGRLWRLGLGLAAGAAIVGVSILLLHRHPALGVASSASSSKAPASGAVVGLLDHPPPATTSTEAAAAYRRALTDLRDGVHAPSQELLRAIRLDPEFAAAHLRLAMALDPPSSTQAYGEAVRFRSSLDARDQEILYAEEPIAQSVPPDVAEGERRYEALRRVRRQDVEILMRLATVRGLRDPLAARATFQELLDLAPGMAGGELAAGDNAQDADDRNAAVHHYEKCIEGMPRATHCLQRLARLEAQSGRCDAYAKDMTRVLVLEPNDWFFRMDGLSATLTAGAAHDDVRSAIGGVLRASTPSEAPFYAEELEGEVALWQGSLTEAREAFSRAEGVWHDQVTTFMPRTTEQRLAVAEELGDDREIASVVREYMGARALSTPWASGIDPFVLTALLRHRILPRDEVLRLRDRWAQDATGDTPSHVWLDYDASCALTETDARQALASGLDAGISHASLDANARLGHLLLLAGRTADAASRLELVAFNCAVFWGEFSYIPQIVPAAYELGQARENLGDTAGACAAYRRVRDRWGRASPRSATANAASVRFRALACAN